MPFAFSPASITLTRFPAFNSAQNGKNRTELSECAHFWSVEVVSRPKRFVRLVIRFSQIGVLYVHKQPHESACR